MTSPRPSRGNYERIITPAKTMKYKIIVELDGVRIGRVEFADTLWGARRQAHRIVKAWRRPRNRGEFELRESFTP